MKLLFAALIVLLISTFTLTTSQPAFSLRHWSCGVADVMEDIVRNHLPKCEIILLHDKYFTFHMSRWIRDFEFPYYSVSLDDVEYPDPWLWQKKTKASGFLCTTLVVTCLSFESCRNPGRVKLYQKLLNHGILLKQRRTVVYIHDFNVNRDVINSPIDDLDSTSKSYRRINERKIIHHDRAEAAFIVREATNLFESLHSHITVVLDLDKGIHEYTPENSNFYCAAHKIETFYETITFSPNWLPGGTPVLRNTWSSKTGFKHSSTLSQQQKETSAVMISLSQLRLGGTVRYCVPGIHVLPYINVNLKWKTAFKAYDELNKNNYLYGLAEMYRFDYVQGYDAELMKVFHRRFGLTPDIFEATDQENGKKNSCGQWTGTMGHVLRKEADFGVGQMAFTQERFRSGLKFSPVQTTSNAVAVCPMPKFAPRFEILALPYDGIVWFYIFITFLVCIAMIDLMQELANRFDIPGSSWEVHTNRNRDKLSPNSDYWKELQWTGNNMGKLVDKSSVPRRFKAKIPWIQIIGVMFLNSVTTNRLSRNLATLLIFCTWLLTSFVCATAYLTILIGALSFPPKEPYVKSPADILKTKTVWSISNIVRQAIQNSTIESEIRLYEGAATIPISTHRSGAIYKYANLTGNCVVAEQGRATFYLKTFLQVTKNNHRYPLFYTSKGSLFIGAIGWVMREDLDFLIEDYFDQLFLEVAAFGLYLKVIREWIPKDYKNIDHIQDIDPLDFETVRVIFVFSAYGMCFSFVIFLCEIIVHKLLRFISHLDVQIRYNPPPSNAIDTRNEREPVNFTLVW